MGLSSPASTDSPKIYRAKACIIFVDMVNSTKVWDLIQTNNPTDVQDACWLYLQGLQNEVLRAFIHHPGECEFIKGTGDGFVFHANDVPTAFSASKSASIYVKEFASRSKPLPGTTELRAALENLSFRFVVHWSEEDLVHAAFHLPPQSRQWSDEFGLRPLRSSEQIPFDNPLADPCYPDLFGHNMNYAGRCIHVISGDGIYLTRAAHRCLEGIRGGEKIELDWQIEAWAKGMENYLVFHKYLEDPKQANAAATVESYKTKALVIQRVKPTDHGLFSLANDIFDLNKKTYSRLYAHVFVKFRAHYLGTFYLDSPAESLISEDSDKDRLMFRVEAPDQGLLEEILVNANGGLANLLAKNVSGAGAEGRADTETRFLRATASEDSKGLQCWIQRDGGYAIRMWYCEVFVDRVADIDDITRSFCSKPRYDAVVEAAGKSIHMDLELLELCRLWGKPAIYLLVSRRGPPDSILPPDRMIAGLVAEWGGADRYPFKLTFWRCYDLAHVKYREQEEP
jgi:hypothetical protein